MDCLFCKIINGDIPSYTIYEDEYVKCFLDISPVEKGHTLIVPKKHFVDNSHIDDEYLLKIHEASKKVVALMNDKFNISGYRLCQNNGSAQEVKHYHLHVLPIHRGKSNKMSVEDVFNYLTK